NGCWKGSTWSPPRPDYRTTGVQYKPRYQGLFHAFSTIVKHEGVLGLWKGTGPTCGRAAVLAGGWFAQPGVVYRVLYCAGAELSSYDQIKVMMKARGFQEGIGLHFSTSLAAGACS